MFSLPESTGMNCPFCGSDVELVDASKTYGKPGFGKQYRCSRYPICDAYVGANKVTGKPLGTLANAPLRELRKRCHKVFDALWLDYCPGEEQRARRSRCYKWLSRRMDIPWEECHIGMFDMDKCQRLLDIFATEAVIIPDPMEEFDGKPVPQF